LEDKTPEEVYAETQQCVNSAATDGGFMLLPGCDISAKVKEENIKAFVNAAKE
jgi:uroporphyrinogen decarboxylase